MHLAPRAFETPAEAASYIAEGFPETSEGNPRLEIAITANPLQQGALRISVLKEGLPDDSVAAEDWRASLTNSDKGWIFGKVEVRRKCRRDEAGWTSKRCS